MTDPVKIPVKIQYDRTGFDQLSRDAEKARKQELAATRAAISEHRRLTQLTGRLDRNLAGPKPTIGQQVGGAIQGQVLGAASVAGMAAMAKMTVSTAAAFVDASNQARVTERTFTALSGGAANATSNLAAMDRATRNLISDQKEQAIANQLLALGVAKNSQELERFVNGARRLGAIKGLGADEAIENLGAAVTNLSYVRLDQMGISASKVRDRVNQLKDAGKSVEEAFKLAVLEEMDATLKRLGPEIETSSEKAQRLAASWDNFGVAAGGAINSLGDAGGVLDGLNTGLESMTAGLNNVNKFAEAIKLLNDQALAKVPENTQKAVNATDALQAVFSPLSFITEKLGVGFLTTAFNADGLAEAYKKVEAAGAAAAAATEEETAATEENTEAQEKAREALERRQEIQRSAAREMVSIDEQASKDQERVWQDYYTDALKLGKDSVKEQKKLAADAAKDIAAIQKGLAKDLGKVDKDLAKDSAKLDKDTSRQIKRSQEQAAKEERAASRQQQIEAAGDERLFQLDLRNMAEEGDAVGIRRALERREIEKQINADKAAEEAQQAERARQEEAAQIRQDAAERKAEMQASAEERRQELRAAAGEDMTERQAELAQAQADEATSFQDRQRELQTFRAEKLAQLEASKRESIEALARELAEAGELTDSELNKLVGVAAQYGEAAGKSFADGLRKGTETMKEISRDLGLRDESGVRASSAFATPGAGGSIPSFAGGGVVPGPIGSPQLVVAHGGETISQGGVNISVNGPGLDKFSAYLQAIVSKAVDDYDLEISERLN